MRSEEEKRISRILKADGKSYAEIGKILKVSRDVARNLCREKILIKVKPGPKPKIGKYESTSIKRESSRLANLGERVNSAKIRRNCHLSCSEQTVRRFLVSNLQAKYKNIRQRLFLNRQKKDKRISTIEQWITQHHDWQKTIFTDEKVFSLDGPDDHRTYVFKNYTYARSKRICGGYKLMVWLMALPTGLLAFRIVRSKFNSKIYMNLLKERMLAIAHLNIDDFWLQSDNSRIHTAKCITDFLQENNIRQLIWPPYSPDLNIVEDIWSKISYEVYDGPQFTRYQSLEAKIVSTINNINSKKREDIIKLFHSVPRRIVKVLRKDGGIWNK